MDEYNNSHTNIRRHQNNTVDRVAREVHSDRDTTPILVCPGVFWGVQGVSDTEIRVRHSMIQFPRVPLPDSM